LLLLGETGAVSALFGPLPVLLLLLLLLLLPPLSPDAAAG
jgi:hypothetical protein